MANSSGIYFSDDIAEPAITAATSDLLSRSFVCTLKTALATTGAKVRIDAHMIAYRRNGAGRAKIEAARAAGNLRARVGAEVRFESDIARFGESADEIARLQYCLQQRRGMARIGAQIAVAQIGRGEERFPAREIDDDPAARPHAVP